MWLALALILAASTSQPQWTCATLDARIAKRRQFLAIRQRENVLHPLMPSRYCMQNPDDEDCQPLPAQQDQRDVSRSVSELTQRPGQPPPETDPVLLPLLRQRREMKCPGLPPQAPDAGH
jgi:hypothetical protein